LDDGGFQGIIFSNQVQFVGRWLRRAHSRMLQFF
jgi:hypothetical protein